MIALKKIAITSIGILFSLHSQAQEKGDIGLLFSTSEAARIGLEFRKPLGEKYKFKIGLSHGDNYKYSYGHDQIVSISDSTVTERIFVQSGYQSHLRIGVERQLGNSMFSIGGDLILGYKNELSYYVYEMQFLQENGTWGHQWPNYYDWEDEMYLHSNIIRHYLVTGARLNLNMDVPLGKGFLLNLSTAATLGLPIYMGASVHGNGNEDFIGTPPSIIDLDMSGGIGLRYQFGSNPRKQKD